jgi:hypothetical protein
MPYGDVIVIDISRNLLLIMSNRQHVAQNNDVICLSCSKYSKLGAPGRIFILIRFNNLQGILSKLFMGSILGRRLFTYGIILF